jgi:15-cis-phytoene synthase
MSAVDVQAAYRHCESVTRDRARNFYYGIRLLPPAKRSALCAVYAFARRVDDIGDGPLEPQEKLDRLATARTELAQLNKHPDPVLLALADVSTNFPLPLKAFGELIEGVEMDVRGTSYPTFDDLAHYCRCVAGSIGRLSLGVFGSSEPHAAPVLADKLGIAMQLTNILRDLREDADNGRVYLPKEDLVRFGCDGELGAAGGAATPEGFTRLIGFQVARAQRFFAEGLRLLPMLDRRSAACVSAMSGIYRELLARIARRPEAVLETRVSLPTWRKARIAARSLLGMTPRGVDRAP